MQSNPIAYFAAALFFATATAWAGGGPLNTLVVVNDASADSLELGSYYAERRGIPDRNIFHLATTTNYSVDTVAFTNQIRAPILDYLAIAGLSNQVDCIVFSRDIPYRVFHGAFTSRLYSGLTASMFYDFKSSPDTLASGLCHLPADSAQSYYESERAFAHAGPMGSNHYYLSALLTALTADESRRLVDRSVAADHVCPTSFVYLLHTTDYARNAQWPGYDNTDFISRFLAAPQQRIILDTNAVAHVTNVVGYMMGSTFVTGLDTVKFSGGAYGEHLTSFGGYLFDGAQSPEPFQMTALNWIRFGCVGAYGTVVEPCAYTNKFSSPRIMYWYARGFSLGESHWMAVQNPYQGVFVGDPLCAPYAVSPTVLPVGLAAGATVSGVITVGVDAATAGLAGRVDQVDAFIDGVRLGAMTNALPAAGNVLTCIVAGKTSAYVVVSGDTVFSSASGLAGAINASGAGVTAKATADHIELIGTNFGFSESNIAYSIAASAGTAGVLTVTGRAATSYFLDGIYPAREFLALRGTANTGDTVSCIITLTNGLAVTNIVVAANGELAASALTRLMGLINTNISLQGADGVAAKYFDQSDFAGASVDAALEARTPGPQGFNLFVDYAITRAIPTSGFLTGDSFADRFNDNGDVLRARGALFLSGGATSLVASCLLDTVTLPDGPHELDLMAYEGSALKTQGRARVPFTVDNNSITCTVFAPLPGQHLLRGVTATVDVSAVTGAGAITQVCLLAEGKVVASTNAAGATILLNTTGYGAGFLRLQGRADDAAGRSAVSEVVTITLFTDEDGDGLSDQWEYVNFGSATNAVGSEDQDGDGQNNLAEYLSDSEPTNAAMRFEILSLASQPLDEIRFTSRTTRQYRVEVSTSPLENEGAWTPATTNFVEGQFDDMTWTNTAPATNAFRAYRVNALRP